LNWTKLIKNIPSRISVRNKDAYEVVFIKDFVNDKAQVGETRFTERQILLKENQTDKQKILTLFHEYLHAISAEYDADLTEKQVSQLEPTFHSFRKFFLVLEGKKKG
jgi:Zn-dependent peptidase ImmA (M78 family)